MTDPPPHEKIKQKMVLAIRTRPPKAGKEEPIPIDMKAAKEIMKCMAQDQQGLVAQLLMQLKQE